MTKVIFFLAEKWLHSLPQNGKQLLWTTGDISQQDPPISAYTRGSGSMSGLRNTERTQGLALGMGKVDTGPGSALSPAESWGPLEGLDESSLEGPGSLVAPVASPKNVSFGKPWVKWLILFWVPWFHCFHETTPSWG